METKETKPILGLFLETEGNKGGNRWETRGNIGNIMETDGNMGNMELKL